MGIVKKLVLITLILALVSFTGCVSSESAGKLEELTDRLENQIEEIESLKNRLEDLEIQPDVEDPDQEPQEIIGFEIQVSPDPIVGETYSHVTWMFTIINTTDYDVYLEEILLQFYCDGDLKKTTPIDPIILDLPDNCLEAGDRIEVGAGGNNQDQTPYDENHIMYVVNGRTADGTVVTGKSEMIPWIILETE